MNSMYMACVHACNIILAQGFIAAVMLVYWDGPEASLQHDPLDSIELFAGRARITRIAHACGYRGIAADQVYDPNPDNRSALHLNTNAGFSLPRQHVVHNRARYARNKDLHETKAGYSDGFGRISTGGHCCHGH